LVQNRASRPGKFGSIRTFDKLFGVAAAAPCQHFRELSPFYHTAKDLAHNPLNLNPFPSNSLRFSCQQRANLSLMISRKALRFPFPKRQIQKAESDAQAGVITPETSQKIINFYKTRYYRQQTLQPGEGDPKLANAIIELAKGPGAVKVPTDTVGLHFDFAKAQYGGHMGARYSNLSLTFLLSKSLSLISALDSVT
jgi:hypothetical protein